MVEKTGVMTRPTRAFLRTFLTAARYALYVCVEALASRSITSPFTGNRALISSLSSRQSAQSHGTGSIPYFDLIVQGKTSSASTMAISAAPQDRGFAESRSIHAAASRMSAPGCRRLC